MNRTLPTPAFVLTTALIILAMAASASAQEKALQGVVVSVSGNVKVTARGGAPADVASGSLIPVGSEIRTESNGETSLGLSPGLALTLKPGTRVTVLQATETPGADGTTARSALLEMPEGRLVVLLPEREKETFDLRIKTPQGIIKPRGSFYALLVKEGQSFLAVSEGKVGLEQFIPVTQEDLEAAEAPAAPAAPTRGFGSVTTSSPRG